MCIHIYDNMNIDKSSTNTSTVYASNMAGGSPPSNLLAHPRHHVLMMDPKLPPSSRTIMLIKTLKLLMIAAPPVHSLSPWLTLNRSRHSRRPMIFVQAAESVKNLFRGTSEQIHACHRELWWVTLGFGHGIPPSEFHEFELTMIYNYHLVTPRSSWPCSPY